MSSSNTKTSREEQIANLIKKTLKNNHPMSRSGLIDHVLNDMGDQTIDNDCVGRVIDKLLAVFILEEDDRLRLHLYNSY